MGGGLYAVAMAKGFPVLWVHTRGLADVAYTINPGARVKETLILARA